MKLLTTYLINFDSPLLTFIHGGELINIQFDSLDTFIDNLLFYHHIMEYDIVEDLHYLKDCGILEIETGLPFIRLKIRNGSYNEAPLYQYNATSNY